MSGPPVFPEHIALVLTELGGIARRYGAVLPDIANLVKVHSWWATEHPGAHQAVVDDRDEP